MSDSKRIVFDLDLDKTRFDEGLSEAAKQIIKLNAVELKQLESKLGVLEKIVLQYDLLSKSKGLDPKQTAKVNAELKEVEKTYKQIQKTANAPKNKQQDPLDKKAVKAIQEAEKAYIRFGKVASGKVKDIADEVIDLANSGKKLETPEQYAQQLGKSEQAAQSLKIAISELRKENRQLLKTGEELTSTQKKQLDQNAKSIAKSENLLKKLGIATRGLKKDFEVFDEAKDSTFALDAQLKRLQKQYRKLGADAKASAEGQSLAEEISQLDEQLNNSDKSIGLFFRNIGRYKESIIGAAKETDGFGSSFKGTIKGIGNAAKALAANPLFALLALLATVGGAIAGAITKSEAGAAILEKAFNAVKAVFLVLTRAVDSAIKALQNLTFDNIIEGFKAFNKAIIANVINRFKGLLELIKAVKVVLDKGLKEGAKAASEALTKIATGQTVDDFKKLGNAVAGVAKEVANVNSALNAFTDLQKRVTRENAALTVSLAMQSAEVEKLTQAADNDTKAWGEREQAAKDARKAIESQSRTQIQLAKNNLAVIQTQFNLAAGTKEQIELEQELADAKAALIEAEASQIVTREDNNERLAKIISDRLEIELDVYLDNFDNIKGINEQLIADETLTFEARKKILEDTKELGRQAFREQLSVLQQVTGVTISENEFIKASNSSVFLTRLRELGLSEKFETRALEIFRDRRSAIQDLSQAEKDLLKEQKERAKERAENEEKAGLTIADLTKEIEGRRLQYIKESQQAETAASERENKQQIASIESKYQALKEAAQEQAEGDLFSDEKLKEYIEALEVLEGKAKEAQKLALQASVLEINEKALKQAIQSTRAVAESLINTEADRIEAEQQIRAAETFAQGSITYKQYQEQLTKIAAEAAKRRQEIELESLQTQLAQVQARIKETAKAAQGLKVDKDLILSDEDLEAAESQLEKLKTAIAEAKAGIATGDIEEPATDEPDPDGDGLNNFINYYKAIEDAAIQTFRNITDEQIRQADRQLSIQEQRIETAKEFFRKGNEDYLAQEEARQIELEKQREKAVRRQQAIDKASQISSVLTGLLQEFGKGGLTSAGAAFAGISALLAIIPSIIPTQQNFNKGTRYVKGQGGIDNVPANLTVGERVTPAERNKKYMESYDVLDKEQLTPSQAYERLTSPNVPSFNYERVNKAIKIENSNANLEIKIGQMIEEQKATKEIIAAMQMNVSLDAKGFAAYQQKLAERRRAEML